MAIVKDYAEVTGVGVANSLSEVSITPELVEYLKKRREDWKTFGKMDSHLYRGWLFREMESSQLSGEAKMLVYAMACIIKSQPRIVQAMKDTPETEQYGGQGVWFAVRNFFDTKCTQYVTKSRKEKKFPVVNIPNTLPGLDILMWCLTSTDEDRTMENLARRPTFTQVHLTEEAQTLAKQGYEYYWTRIIKGTKNDDKVEKPGMNEDFYNTASKDMYRLYMLDRNGRVQEYPSTNTDRSYSSEMVRNYLRSFEGPEAQQEEDLGQRSTTS
jgi:hypothetical protein